MIDGCLDSTIADSVKRHNLIYKLHRFGNLTFDEISRRLKLGRSTVYRYYSNSVIYRPQYNRWQHPDSIGQLDLRLQVFNNLIKCRKYDFISQLASLNKEELLKSIGIRMPTNQIDELIEAVKLKYPDSNIDKFPQDSLYNLSLPIRAREGLNRLNITTISALSDLSFDELLAVPGVGVHTAKDIQNCIDEYWSKYKS